MDMFHHRQEVFVALDGVAIGQADVQEWQLPWSKQTSPQKTYQHPKPHLSHTIRVWYV